MDPYKVLGVTQNATQDEIKSAYRKLAKKLHPDLNPGNKEVETRFKEVNNAYELVGTPEARTKFAEQKERPQRRGPPGEDPSYYYETQRPRGGSRAGGRYTSNFEGFDPSMFADLFGDASGGRRDPRPPEDHHYSMEVDFVTSTVGGEREITLPSGKKLKVKIPPGVKSGTKLRLANQGEQIDAGSRAGDAYIEINVLPSNVFKRVNDDIEVELPLSLNEGILGGEVRVQTVDGPVMLKVPAGLTTGSRVRMKGKGVPHQGTRGDQYAIIKIVMPSKVDPELDKFFQEWSKSHGYNPREDMGSKEGGNAK
jgi:DnaJ-class molecular chaperone